MSAEWLPLESNPTIITEFMHKIGVEKGVECTDVFGFDGDLLSYIPRPCYALLLCFPDSDKMKKFMAPIYETLNAGDGKVPEGVFFMKQKIRNACGTFALIHSLANSRDRINLGDGALKQWLDKAIPLGVEERSDSLAKDSELASAHAQCAKGGKTNAGAKVSHHFICFVNHGGHLYQIDSAAPLPRDLGKTDDGKFLEDAGKECKKLMSQLDNVSFSALAIVRTSD